MIKVFFLRDKKFYYSSNKNKKKFEESSLNFMENFVEQRENCNMVKL